MATYKPKKKIDNNGTLEEVKIPIESVDGLRTELNWNKNRIQDLDEKITNDYATKDDVGSVFENIGNIDTWFDIPNNVEVLGSDGVTWNEEYAFYDKKNEQTIVTGQMAHRVPFQAGDGISFEPDVDSAVVKIKTNLTTEEVEAVDLPTVKAKLKPASEIGGGVGTGYELSYVNIEPAENNMFDNVDIANQKVRFNLRVIEMSFGDSDNVVWSGQDVTLDLPIVAGKGITFEPMQELGESALTISLAEAEREEVFDLDGNDYINKGDRVFEILNHAKGVVRGQYIVHNGFGTSPTSYRIMRFQFTNQQDIYHINTHTVERNVTYTENGVEYANANIVVYVVIGGALSINAYAFDITNGRSVTLTQDTTKPHRIVLDYIDYD